MSEHTPTPWKRDGQFIRSEPAWSRGIVADFPLPPQGGLFDAVANIEFAVRAVNAHDALLEAAEAAQKRCPDCAGTGCSLSPPDECKAISGCCNTCRALRAAIHLAKGNQP